MQLMDKIRQLSPVHQTDVYHTVVAQPMLKQKFYSGHGHGKGSTTGERSTLLTQFEKYAGWTVPALFPQEHIGGMTEMQLDYQSFGAQAVNNLANKIVTTLFHPTRPFFKAEAPKEYVEQSGKSIADIEMEMSGIEREAMKRFAKRDGRTVATDVAMQLIVTGNSLWHTPRGKPYRHFTYRDYDATFDSFGDMQSCIVREWMYFDTLPEKHKAICARFGKRAGDVVEVFTGIKRLAMDYYVVWQEMDSFCVLSEDYGVYSKDTLEYKPLRLLVVPGRHAGVGIIEQLAGDFHTMSKMSEAELDMLAIMCDVKTLVKPGSGMRIEEYNNALPGQAVAGDPDYIKSHTHNVAPQAEFIANKNRELARRLSQMFLMNQNAIRDAERVTAEEIRLIASELDQVHGGAYSRLARTLQRPLATDLLQDISPMLKGFEPLIITGLESLSRMSELDNIRGMVNDMTAVGAALQGPQGRWLNLEKITKKIVTGWGVDPNEVMNTAAEVAAEDERLMQQQAAIAAANELPKQIAK